MRRPLLVLLLAATAGAQPLPAPPFTINRKITLAQVSRGGRVEMEYDYRGMPARSLKVVCYRYQGPKGSEPVQEWKVSDGQGKLRLDFSKFPSSQYLFRATLLNERDEPVPVDFRPVQLEYGGWVGRLRVEEATRAAAARTDGPFSDAAPAPAQQADYAFKVTPDAPVVNPSKSIQFLATLNDMPMAESLEWKLEGPGRIQVVENCFGLYTAPKGAANGQRATLYVWSPQHPHLRQAVQILISSEVSQPDAPAPRQ